jgi:hypothetical protein
VKPGSLKKSYLTRSLFGNAAVFMPDGCPLDPTAQGGRCLTQSEIYLILPGCSPAPSDRYLSFGCHVPAWSHFT